MNKTKKVFRSITEIRATFYPNLPKENKQDIDMQHDSDLGLLKKLFKA